MSSDPRTAAGSALIAVVVIVSGCGSDGIPLREDPQLLARAQQVIRDGGGPVLFRELAGGDWDRVHVFPGPPSLELIESDLGARIAVSGSYTPDDGGVIVFTNNGVVQRAVRLEPYPFDGDLASYGRHVIVQRPHPGAGSLEFVDLLAMRAPRLR